MITVPALISPKIITPVINEQGQPAGNIEKNI